MYADFVISSRKNGDTYYLSFLFSRTLRLDGRPQAKQRQRIYGVTFLNGSELLFFYGVTLLHYIMELHFRPDWNSSSFLPSSTWFLQNQIFLLTWIHPFILNWHCSSIKRAFASFTSQLSIATCTTKLSWFSLFKRNFNFA